MVIFTNPGSNLSPEVVQTYGVRMPPQQIVVDGVHHDTSRESIGHAKVDFWVKTAKAYPYIIGTSAREFVEQFLEVGKDDPEILAIMTSKKLIASYQAAISATRTLETRRLKIRVVDTGTTDGGACLLTILAGEAKRRGLGLDATVQLLEKTALESTLAFTLGTLDNLVRGGRASFLKAWIANILERMPLLTLVDGELKSSETLRRTQDRVQAMLDFLAARNAPSQPLWGFIAHGGAPEEAKELRAKLRQTLEVRWVDLRPLHPSIYLHAGPRALACFLMPCPPGWVPSVPVAD